MLKVALPGKDGKKLSGKQLLSILNEVVKVETTVISDEFKSYNILQSKESNFKHYVVNHSLEYTNGNIYTNGIESFWATLKRRVYGVYHSISPKYLQQYVNEFCFRHNNKNNKEVFDVLLGNCILM